MDQRKCITLLYNFNENWMGGTYYVLNIIRALNYLDDVEKPSILVLYDQKSSTKPIEEIGYPYIHFQAFNFTLSYPKRIINKLFYYLTGDVFFKQLLPVSVTNNIYPLTRYIDPSRIQKGYYWIPDFQEKYMPELFSKYEIRLRDKSHKRFVKEKLDIVFSSETAKKDFDKFYPENNNKKEVLRFASIIEKTFLQLNIHDLLQEYKINKPYFIIPNQFWKHKNHLVILEAARILRDRGIDIQMVLTGKEHDYRNPEYAGELRSFVSNNNLTSRVLFLGFIPRENQLQLMNNSIAIIQPSLFEGWSTVVEDSKVLGHHIIVSDIPIHREQISTNCTFFTPQDASDLVAKIVTLLDNYPKALDVNYDAFILSVARQISSLF